MSSKGNGSSVQLPPTAGVSTADTAEEDVQRYASQEPLRSAVSSGRVASLFNCWHGASPSQAASQIDMAVIWVHKAAKGSNQWSDEGTQRQIAHYRVRKKMKPLTMLIKTIYLGLAFFEVPSWCLNHNVSTCLEHRDSWGIPELPFQVSNGIDIFCLLYLAQCSWHRRCSLGPAAVNRCWHRVRVVLVLLALVDCGVAIFNTVGIVPGSFRVCRVCRPLILMCATKFLRRTLNRLFRAFLDFWTVLVSLALCVLFFVWLGLVIFARSKEGQDHFDVWSRSLASLWILFTTANFPDVMIDSYNSVKASFFFFFFYLVISLYLLNNILLAAVYDAYKAQLRVQLQTFYRKKAYSIDRAFHLLASSMEERVGARFQDGEAGIDQARWMDFFTSYAAAAGKIGSHRDAQFVKQQAQQSFEALDSDGSGMITGEEFKLVVHVLSDPQVYIPLRPIPEVGSTAWGKRMRRLFTDGVPAWGNHRIPWWVLIDLVVLVEISLAFVQTCLFIAPAGAEFNDQPLQAGSIWFRLLSCTTVIFLFDTSLHIVTFGLERYWNRRRLRHCFDVLSIFALFSAEIAAFFLRSAPDYLLRTVLALHISRGLCLTHHIQPLRYLAAMVAHLVPVYHQLGFLLFLVFYVFATIGVQIFGGQIYKGNPKLNGSAFAQGEYWGLNFNDFPSGLVTLFCLMVVNNWFVVADGFLRVTNNAAAIFFVSFFVITNLVVLNILMTLILESSATVREELQAKIAEADTDAPQRTLSRGAAREFVLQRMLLNEDERLDAIVSGTSGHLPGRQSPVSAV